MTPYCVVSFLIHRSPPVTWYTCVSEWIVNLIDVKRIFLSSTVKITLPTALKSEIAL